MTIPWEAMDPDHADHADWVAAAGRCFASHDHETWLEIRARMAADTGQRFDLDEVIITFGLDRAELEAELVEEERRADS